MKKSPVLTLALGLLLAGHAQAQEPKQDPKPAAEKPVAAAPKTAPATAEERFKALFTKATLSGRWAPLKDGVLGEEKTGDKYQIVSATKGKDDKWIIHAKMKYREQEFVMPIPVTMKFVDETAILVVDNLSFAYGGVYSAPAHPRADLLWLVVGRARRRDALRHHHKHGGLTGATPASSPS